MVHGKSIGWYFWFSFLSETNVSFFFFFEKKRLPFNFDQIDYLQTELPRRSQGDLHVPYAVFGTFRTNTSVDT